MNNRIKTAMDSCAARVAVFAMVILSIFAIGAVAVQYTRYTQCTAEWANKTVAVQNQRAGYRATYDQALQNLLVGIAANDQAKNEENYLAFLKASDALNQSVKDHPLPSAPSYQC